MRSIVQHMMDPAITAIGSTTQQISGWYLDNKYPVVSLFAEYTRVCINKTSASEKKIIKLL